jgi:hypothetical protein
MGEEGKEIKVKGDKEIKKVVREEDTKKTVPRGISMGPSASRN